MLCCCFGVMMLLLLGTRTTRASHWNMLWIKAHIVVKIDEDMTTGFQFALTVQKYLFVCSLRVSLRHA